MTILRESGWPTVLLWAS